MRLWRLRRWIRSDSAGMVRPHYKAWAVSVKCGQATWAYGRFLYRLVRVSWACGTLFPRLASTRKAVDLYYYAQLDRGTRRRARRRLRRAALTNDYAAGLYASIASPIGMGNDGQKAYDMATRTWFGSIVGALVALGQPWYDPTAAALGGAQPDGTHNVTPALQQTVTKMVATLGGILFLVTGVWLMTSGPVILSGNNTITMWGSGSNTSTAPTRIVRNGAFAMFSLGDGALAGNDYVAKLSLRGVLYDGNNLNADLWQNRNVATQPGRYHFDGINFWAFGSGFAWRDAMFNMESVDSMWNDVNVAFGLCAINLRNGVWILTNCTFGFLSGGGSAGVQLFGNNKSSFYGCVWTTNVSDVVIADAGVVYTNPQRFSGCWFENASNVCLGNSNAANQIDIAYDTCRLHCNTGGAAFHIFWDGTASLINLRNVDFALATVRIQMGPTNTLICEDCRQINRVGKLASPFNTTRNFISTPVSASDVYAAIPVQNTAYQCQGCKGMLLIITGGAGVVVGITDRLGGNLTTIPPAGATPQTLYLPVGHSIHFGAFGVPGNAPAVVAFVQ